MSPFASFPSQNPLPVLRAHLAALLLLTALGFFSDRMATGAEPRPAAPQTEESKAEEEEVAVVPRRRLELEPIGKANVLKLDEIHSEPMDVSNVVWRPDSKEVVCIVLNRGKAGEGVEIRDGETFEVLHTTGQGRTITGFSFNPKSPQVAWVTQEGKIEVLNTESGEGYFIDDVGRNPTMSFRPDGKVIAIGGQSGSIRLCPAETGETIRTIEVLKERYIIQPVFSPDGKLLAVAPPRGSIRVWDVETGDQKCEIAQANNSNILGCLFDPKSERLLTIHQGGKLSIWNATTGESIVQKEMEEQNPTGARWIANGELLATVGPSIVAFWNPVDWSLVHEMDAPKNILSFSVSPDGKRLLAVGRDPPFRFTTVQVWGVTKSKTP